MFPRRHQLLFTAFASGAVALILGCQTSRGTAGDTASGVRLIETNNVIRVEIDGGLFTEYHFRDVTRPFLYPILGPGGAHFTRRWPQDDVPGEEHDHPHHHALWFAHGEANGVDLWSEGEKAGKTFHQYFVETKSGPDVGVLTTRNEWRSKDGKLVATDERTMRFHRSSPAGRLVDFDITIFASQGELVLGDTKEGTLAIRLAESMRVKQPKNQPGAGHIVNSAGDRDGDAWGKRAEWCDYYGPVGERTLGVAIFDHPSNPRHPTWWHVRDYGLFAANPFGLHDFEKQPPKAGDFKIASGQSVTFRYRLLFHEGDDKQARVAERFGQYAQQSNAKGSKP
jgi:hypothetical protein